MEGIYVRLKPYAPNKGFHVLRYHFQERLYIGGLLPRWYKVNVDLANQVRGFKQEENDPDSKLLFDVASEEERQAIDADEKLRLAVAAGMAAVTTPSPKLKLEPIDYTAPPRAAAIPSGRASTGDMVTERLPAGMR